MKSKLYQESEAILTRLEDVVKIIQESALDRKSDLNLVKELLNMYGNFIVLLSNEFDASLQNKFTEEIEEIAQGVGGIMSKIFLEYEQLEDQFGNESLN